MDMAFKKDKYMNYAMLWSGSIGGEASTELVVPDSMPDIGVVLDAEGILSIRSKEADAGRIRATSELSVKILYQPEDGSHLRCLPVTMSCDVVSTVPGADLDCQTVLRLRLRSLEAKAINSRKISVHAELSGSACCLKREEFSLVQGIQSPGSLLHIKTQRNKVCMISDVREKTFVVTDDYAIPAGGEEMTAILLQRVQLHAESSEFVNGKLVFRGKARVFLLLECSDELHPCYFETPFSQIMEISGQDDPAPELTFLLTGAFFDLPEHSGGKISAELHILAQVIAREETELTYISDLYSNQAALQPILTSQRFCTAIRDLSQSRSLSCTSELPPDSASVLYSKSNVTNVTAEEQGVSVSLTVKTVYRRKDNSFSSTVSRLKESFEAPVSADEILNVSAVSSGDSFSLISDNALEVRVPVQVLAHAAGYQEIAHLEAVEQSAEMLEAKPSLTLVYANGRDDLWLLAKKHRSSCDAIRKANDGRDTGLLLIPKAR